MEAAEVPRSHTSLSHSRPRGRPPLWSESLQKRLVMLRMCDLELKEILQVISCLDERLKVTEKNQERRPQQILREILCDGTNTNRSLSSMTAGHLVTLFRSIKSSPSKSQTYPARKDYQCQPHPTIADDPTFTAATTFRTRMDVDNVEPLEGSIASTTSSELHQKVFSTLQKSVLSGFLRRHNRTSSCISGIISLLGKFTVQDTGHKASPAPPAQDNLGPLDDEIARIRALQNAKTQAANSAVIQMCCRHKINCLHRDFLEGHLPLDLEPFRDEVNAIDPFVNNFLFFAARSGASIDVLTRIAIVTADLNAVNDDGQTFMFVLDPKAFCKPYLGIYSVAVELLLTNWTGNDPHACGRFIVFLQVRGYKFLHKDNDGRFFLTCLSIHPNFDIDFLKMLVHSFWPSRLGADVQIMSMQPDRKMAFLLDYLCCCSGEKSITEQTLFALKAASWRCGSSWGGYSLEVRREAPESPQVVVLKTILNPRKDGVPRRHVNIHTLYNDRKSALRRDHSVFSIHAGNGETGLHQCLLRTFRRGQNIDFAIFSSHHINFNARCFVGRTVVHLSTMYNRPDVLKQILAVNYQKICVNNRDEHGFTPLDYAVDQFNKSRTPTGTAKQLANAMKCIVALVDYGAQLTFSPTAKEGRIIRNLGTDITIPVTEPISEGFYL